MNGADADLPGIDALQIDVSGWTRGDQSADQRSWYQPGAVLSLSYFPVPPDVTHAVGDDRALQTQFERNFAEEAQMALVEARWVDGPAGLSLAEIILKGMMMPQRRMTYIGSLIVPFARCSWVVRMQAMEGSPTGVREAIWLNKYLADGGDLDSLGFVKLDGPAGPDARVTVRRTPSDDAEWDNTFPGHPLSRVRNWLPACRLSMVLSQEALTLEPFRAG